MAFEWVAGLFQSEQTRGLSGDSAHTVALDDANPYYNYRLRRHKADGDVVERPALLWYTSPYVKRRQGLGTHVASEVGEGVANYTDVLLILSADDHDRADENWFDETTRVLQGEFDTYCRREGFSRLHAHRPVAFRILRDGSEEMGGQKLGLGPGEFVTGLLPNLYTGPVRGSFPVIGVNVNLPGVWEGYQEVGRLYSDQILFTLGNHWLDNFRHPSLEQAALYRLRQYPDGSFVHIVNPDLQDSYQVTTANQGGASVLTLATRSGKPLAYIVLAVIDPPSSRPGSGPPPVATPAPSSARAASSARPSAKSTSDVPNIAPPMLAEDPPIPAVKTGSSKLGGKTIVPDAPSERIFTLQERGAMLQKVHFSAFMLGYDVYLGRRGELGTHVESPAATFQVRKRSVSIVAHIDGVKVGGRPVPADVEVPIEGDMGIEFGGQRFEYRDLRWVKADRWPYVGEIRRPASSTYMIWGEEYHVGRSRECRVVLPDEPRNENIHWKPSMGDGATIRTRTKEIPKSRFYTDSIMVASEHATIDLKHEVPEVVCTAKHCYVYVRRPGSSEELSVIELFPTKSESQPQATAMQPGDEVLIGNCLFHVGFTPASDAAATAPAPKVEFTDSSELEEPTADDLANSVDGPDLAGLDSATPAPAPSRDVPSIAPPAMLDDDSPSIAPPAMLDEADTAPTMDSTDTPPSLPPVPESADEDAFAEEEVTIRGKQNLAQPPPMPATPPPLPEPVASKASPPPLDAGDSMLDDLEESDDEPTTPGMVVPTDLEGPAYEPSAAMKSATQEETGEEALAPVEPGPDVGGWDQDDWDAVPKGLEGSDRGVDDESIDDAPTGSAQLPLADLENEPSSVPTPFPDIQSVDTPSAAADEVLEPPPQPAEAASASEPESGEDAPPPLEVDEPPSLRGEMSGMETVRMQRLPSGEASDDADADLPEAPPTEEAPLAAPTEEVPSPEAASPETATAEPSPPPPPPVDAPHEEASASGVVFMDDSEAQFELGRPLHLVHAGWMINGEVTLGNHTGAELVLPENRITEDQVFEARDYFRLKVRGRRATLTLLTPSEVLIDEDDADESTYRDVEKRIIDVIRRDDTGEEDFAVRLQLKQDKALPDPRARLLGIDVDDPLAAALVTRGVPKGAPRTVQLGDGLQLTIHFDGSLARVTDYLDTYRNGGVFRPFFVQREGQRFVTAPEDGTPFELRSGDRLVVDACLYVLRQE